MSPGRLRARAARALGRGGPQRPPRAEFVERLIPKRGVGAEIGVHRGEFTAELLAIAAPTRLHLLDLWYLLGPEWHWGKGGERSTVGALREILARYEDQLVAGRLRLEIGDDLESLAGFDDDYFDWVYLDSSHLYEHTLAELRLLEAKVKPSGVIAGDDWLGDPGHPHHGVSRAVREFVAERPYDLVYANEADLQWAIRARPRSG